MSKRRRFLLVLGGLTVLGILIRAAACLEMHALDSVRNPAAVTDMATYYRLAQGIVREGRWPAFFDYQPFYYTVFLPLCFLASPSGSVWPVLVAQTLLAGGAIWLAGIGAARIGGRRAGALAAGILALARTHVFYTPFMLLEVLQSFWMALILFLGLGCMRRNRWHAWSALGLATGLSALTRGNALLLLPGCLALAAWRNRGRRLRALLFCGLLLVFFQLPQLPYSLRNLRAKGRWCGPSAAGDKVLALGNTPEAPAGGLEYPLTYRRWCALAENPDPAERTGVPALVLDWLRRDPLTWLELKWRMLLLFWDRREIPNNVSLQGEGAGVAALHLPFLLDFSVIGTLALMGVGFCLARRRPEDWYLVQMILMYCGGTVAFYILARFRLGCLPLLAAAGGVAGSAALARLERSRRCGDAAGRRRLLLPVALAALVAFFLVNLAYSRYQMLASAGVMRALRPLGTVADFPDETMLYDHAPAGDGGWFLRPLDPRKPLRLEKTFLLDQDIRRKIRTGTTLQIRIFPARNETSIRGTVRHAGAELPLLPTPRDAFGAVWLACRIPGIHPDATGRAVFSLTIQAASSDSAVAFEQFRNYGRTRVAGEDGRLRDVPCELVARLHWRRPPDAAP